MGPKVTNESFKLVLSLRRSHVGLLVICIKQLIDSKCVGESREYLEKLSRSKLLHVLVVESHRDNTRVGLLDLDSR